MLVGGLGLLDLLLERLARGRDLHELALLHDPLVLLFDQFGLGVEIGDMVAILDLHRLAPDRGGFFDQGQRRIDLGDRRRDRFGFGALLLDLLVDGRKLCQLLARPALSSTTASARRRLSDAPAGAARSRGISPGLKTVAKRRQAARRRVGSRSDPARHACARPAVTVRSSSIRTWPAVTLSPSRTWIAETIPVSSGWMVFVRPVGTILPDAVAMMSTWPKIAQTTAIAKNRMIVAPIARPTGEAGVSRISSAAGRNCRAVSLAAAERGSLGFGDVSLRRLPQPTTCKPACN